MAEPNTSRGTLSRLPRELRDMIYKHYFARAEVTWSCKYAWQIRTTRVRAYYPRDLLVVSKQLRAEAQPWEEHDLCVVFVWRSCAAPLALTRRVRHTRFAQVAIPQYISGAVNATLFPNLTTITYAPLPSFPRVVVSIEWLAALLEKGSSGSLMSCIYTQLKSMDCVPGEFVTMSRQSGRFRPVSRAALPCRVSRGGGCLHERHYTGISLHMAAYPLRAEYVEYQGYRYPVPDASPPSTTTRPHMRPDGTVTEIATRDQEQEWEDEQTAAFPESFDQGGRLIRKSLAKLLSRQPRRFVRFDNDAFQAIDETIQERTLTGLPAFLFDCCRGAWERWEELSQYLYWSFLRHITRGRFGRQFSHGSGVQG